MIINRENERKTENVEFVSYTGKYPNLCSGVLTLKGNYSNSYVKQGEWYINVEALPEIFKKYADEIDRVFNDNVEHGCCGGCL